MPPTGSDIPDNFNQTKSRQGKPNKNDMKKLANAYIYLLNIYGRVKYKEIEDARDLAFLYANGADVSMKEAVKLAKEGVRRTQGKGIRREWTANMIYMICQALHKDDQELMDCLYDDLCLIIKMEIDDHFEISNTLGWDELNRRKKLADNLEAERIKRVDYILKRMVEEKLSEPTKHTPW